MLTPESLMKRHGASPVRCGSGTYLLRVTKSLLLQSLSGTLLLDQPPIPLNV